MAFQFTGLPEVSHDQFRDLLDIRSARPEDAGQFQIAMCHLRCAVKGAEVLRRRSQNYHGDEDLLTFLDCYRDKIIDTFRLNETEFQGKLDTGRSEFVLVEMIGDGQPIIYNKFGRSFKQNSEFELLQYLFGQGLVIDELITALDRAYADWERGELSETEMMGWFQLGIGLFERYFCFIRADRRAYILNGDVDPSDPLYRSRYGGLKWSTHLCTALERARPTFLVKYVSASSHPSTVTLDVGVQSLHRWLEVNPETVKPCIAIAHHFACLLLLSAAAGAIENRLTAYDMHALHTMSFGFCSGDPVHMLSQIIDECGLFPLEVINSPIQRKFSDNENMMAWALTAGLPRFGFNISAPDAPVEVARMAEVHRLETIQRVGHTLIRGAGDYPIPTTEV